MGLLDDAARENKRAVELDPLSLNITAEMGSVLIYQGQYDAAIEQERKTLELDPNFHVAHSILGKAFLLKGKYADAITEGQKAGNDFVLARAYLKSGNSGKAREVVQDLVDVSKKRFVSADDIASGYIGLEDKERALEWLEKAQTRNSRRSGQLHQD